MITILDYNIKQEKRLDILLSKCESVTETGCLIWPGYVNSSGYVTMWYKGKVQAVHRLVYERYNSSIPKGMCILHMCNTRSCLNYRHLKLGTQSENIRMGWELGTMTGCKGYK